MDKPATAIPKPRKRNGFALLVTLSVLIVIIALLGVLLSYFDEVRRDASDTKALIQANLFYSDIKKTFSKIKDRESLYSKLYTAPIPFYVPETQFELTLSCAPLGNGVNINWLREDTNGSGKKEAAYTLFESIVKTYEVEDANMLQEMLLQEIGSANGTVQNEARRLPQKSGIVSYKQFEQVLAEYQNKTDDTKAAQIPWKKYFVFNPYAETIDSKNVSAEFIALFFDRDVEEVRENWIEGESKLKDIVQNFAVEYGELFSDKQSGLAACNVSFLYEGAKYRFRFVDIRGEVKHFEFYGKE